MTDWQCGQCRAQVSPGAPRCPHCPSTEFDKPEAEAEMLKIARDGSVSDSADAAAVPLFFEQLADVRTALTEANAEAPAGGEPGDAEAPQAPAEAPEPVAGAPAPAVLPRMPPRHVPPPGAPVG